MASLNIALDAVEQVLRGYDDVVWVDDVAQYQCTRCHKVLVNHYVANCLHKFCSNCKRILDDGSHRWRCPNCQQFIVDMDGQNLEFKNRVKDLRLHCPNRKYGCQHKCQLKNLKEHLDKCENTRERALPVLYEGELTTQMLERMFTMEMLEVRREMAEMKQTILELKDRNKEGKGLHEGSWDLSVEVNEMRQKMSEMEKKQKDAKEKYRTKLSYVNDRIDGIKSDLIVETNRLTNDFEELRKNEEMRNDNSLVVEENKSKILKLEGKAESYFEMIEFNNRKNNEFVYQLKNELENKLKSLDTKVQQTNAEAENLASNEKKYSEEITKLSEGIESLNRDLLNNRSEYESVEEKLLAAVENVKKKTDKIGTTLGEHQAEVERIREHFKEHSGKVEENAKSSIDRKMSEMEEKIAFINTEVEKLKNIAEELRTQPLPHPKSENDAAIPLPFSISSIPQMTCFDLVTAHHSFKPEVIWKANDVRKSLQNMSKRYFSWRSSWFTWSKYSVQSHAEITPLGRPSPYLMLHFSLATPLNQLKLMPAVYYVLKDQRGNVRHKSQSKSWLFAEVRGSAIFLRCDLSNEVSFKRTFDRDLRDTSTYNVNDSVEIEIYIEPLSIMQQVHSYDGTLNWAIEKYGKRKKLAKEELALYQESPYFYTGPKGHRVQVLMFLNSNVDVEIGLRAKVMFLRGEFDQDLSMTFAHSTTVTLLDQRNPDGNVSVTVEWDLKKGGEYPIALGSDGDIKNLIKNDNLYYNVTIKSRTND